MNIKSFLKLAKTHFPYDNIGILFCDDGSGRLIKESILHPYDENNLIFSFVSPEHLESYLLSLKD